MIINLNSLSYKVENDIILSERYGNRLKNIPDITEGGSHHGRLEKS